MPAATPWRYRLLWAFTIAAVLFIVSPLAVVVLTSFSSTPYNVFPPEGYSLRWYENLAAQKDFYIGAVRSLVLALASTALSLVIGIMASYALMRFKLRGGDFIKAFLMSPMVLPKIVLGVTVFMFFVRIRTMGSDLNLLVVHVLVCLPFVIAIVSAALANFDWSLEEAARDLGAGPVATFRRVILPQISISIFVAGVFAFITSFDQVETTIFLVRPGQNTLPVEMFLYLQKWQDPTIAALSVVLIVFAGLLAVLMAYVIRDRQVPFMVQKQSEEATG
jgi:putative spermidine/putrescine transport system permease protein